MIFPLKCGSVEQTVRSRNTLLVTTNGRQENVLKICLKTKSFTKNYFHLVVLSQKVHTSALTNKTFAYHYTSFIFKANGKQN